MKENKLTPEEIEKALENKKYGGHSCVNCKYGITKGEDRCGLKGCYIARSALDLINCQQSAIDVYMQENDRLKTAYIQVSMDRDTMLEDLQFRTNQVIEQQAEIERLQNDLAISRKETKRYATRRASECEDCANERAEAIKEFAEKVKDLFVPEDEARKDIDNLVKEMVGEQSV